jgi:phosphatidate cytidylyltransferase
MPGGNAVMAESNSFKNTLIVRAVSGAVLVGVMLSVLWLGGWWWQCFAAAVALGSLGEFYRMYSPSSMLACTAGFVCSALILFSPGTFLQNGFGEIFGACCFIAYFSELYRRQIKGVSDSVKNVMPVVTGLSYTAVPWYCMIQLRRLPYVGYGAVLAIFLCTWSCDVMAYLTGSRWGAKKVCPHISPNKSLEGFIGGFAASLLCGTVCALWMGFSPLAFILTGAVCGTVGQLGDLVESLIKRECGVKDSGKIIPGHGGFLDRFDSVLVNGLCVWLIWWVILQ